MENTQATSVYHQGRPNGNEISETLQLQIKVLHAQAETYRKQGQLNQARQTLFHAYQKLQLATKLNSAAASSDQIGFDNLTITLALIHEQEGRFQEADQFFHDALRHLQVESSRDRLEKAYFLYGQLLCERGCFDAACHYMRLAYEGHRFSQQI